MSAIRDHDQLFRDFLDEGPEVLPDRVLAAIADDVHRQRQRAPLRPWRFTTMRTYLAAAAVALILVVGGGILWANRNSFIGNPTPTATPSPTASPSPSEPGQPVGVLTPGATYQTRYFTQPFTFILPAGFGDGSVRGDTWDGGNTFRLRYDPARGAVTFHHDAALLNDFCQPRRTIQHLPDDIGEWLAGMNGLTVSAPHTLGDAESGPTYWDIELGSNCVVTDTLQGTAAISFHPVEQHRVYDVPVGDDHIVVFTWGAGYNGEGDEVLATLNPLVDELVVTIQPPSAE